MSYDISCYIHGDMWLGIINSPLGKHIFVLEGMKHENQSKGYLFIRTLIKEAESATF